MHLFTGQIFGGTKNVCTPKDIAHCLSDQNQAHRNLKCFLQKGNGSTTKSHFPILIFKEISVFMCMPAPSKENHSQNVLESKNVHKVSRTKVEHRYGKSVFELPCYAGVSCQ